MLNEISFQDHSKQWEQVLEMSGMQFQKLFQSQAHISLNLINVGKNIIQFHSRANGILWTTKLFLITITLQILDPMSEELETHFWIHFSTTWLVCNSFVRQFHYPLKNWPLNFDYVNFQMEKHQKKQRQLVQVSNKNQFEFHPYLPLNMFGGKIDMSSQRVIYIFTLL